MESHLYVFLKFAHIAAAIVALGSTFAFPFMEGLAKRKGTGAMRFVLEFEDRHERLFVRPGAIVIFVLGLAMIAKNDTGYKDEMPVWLTIATVWFIAAFLVAWLVQGRKNVPAGLKALEGVADDSPLPEAFAPIGKRMQIIGGLLGLSVVCITFLMIWKPGE